VDPLILLGDGTAHEFCFVASALQAIGTPYALIGANALLLHGIQLPRTTRDLDFVVAMEDSFQHLTEALLKQRFRHGTIAHRFYTPQGTQIDVPVAPLPILVALKILAATKRYGSDLQDAIACMKQYEEQGARRFDDVVYAESLTFETAGAYLLGRDLASMATTKTLVAVEEALDALRQNAQPTTRTVNRSETDSLLRAFASGVEFTSL